jgi:hypothetical protein
MCQKFSKLSFAVLLSISFLACKNEKLEPDDVDVTNLSYNELEANREVFSKVLAVALTDQSVRELIKTEASKKFDGEDEVLFQTIKSQKLGNGQSLVNTLASIYGSDDKFLSIVKSLPRLTILVPEVYKFSNNKWDIASQIPAVASLKTKNGKVDISELNAFYSDGTTKKLKRNIVPNEAVLVVKDSERVILSDDGNKRVGQVLGKVFQAGDFTFRYLDARYENTNLTKSNTNNTRQFGRWWEVNSGAYNASFHNLQFHRDYVYYGIAPELGVNSGAFRNNIREYITSIRFESVNNISNALDDVVTDWSDGRFEFAITVLFVDDKTAPSSVTKIFDVSLFDLCNCMYSPAGSVTVWSLKTYKLYDPMSYGAGPGNAIEIAPWDMKRYGDTWKFVIQEQDATTSTNYSYTTGITSGYGTNYSSNQKEGPNFGGTTSSGTSYSQTFSLTVAGQSDVLGEALLHWTDKIISTGTWAPENENGDIELIGGGTREISTGTVAISVEPLSF